jgi:hypothetical protein
MSRKYDRKGGDKYTPTLAIVVDVITDATHPRVLDTGDRGEENEPKGLEAIGAIVARPMELKSSNPNNLPLFKALDMSNTDYPIIGETVELLYQGGVRYYRRVSAVNLNLGNATKDKDLNTYPQQEEGAGDKANKYGENNATGTPNASTTENERSTTFGKYFNETHINRLVPYEGDKLIQSRFGQSIRFSGYNNPEKTFAPSIIIRNRQNSQSLSEDKRNTIIEEDVNKDGTTIAMTSGDYKLNFQPGVIDDGGSTNFKSSPNSFNNYPSELKGMDQLLVNSGRILISAKSAEMIFYSKGNYGFISDGNFSIDNIDGGATLDFGDNVLITTNRNNRNFKINTGDGKIFLNTDDQGKSPNTTKPSEPLVRGNTLKELLEKLIDLIEEQVFRTPSGPTAIGPENKPDFTELRGRLTEMLSTKNFTE